MKKENISISHSVWTFTLRHRPLHTHFNFTRLFLGLNVLCPLLITRWLLALNALRFIINSLDESQRMYMKKIQQWIAAHPWVLLDDVFCLTVAFSLTSSFGLHQTEERRRVNVENSSVHSGIQDFLSLFGFLFRFFWVDAWHSKSDFSMITVCCTNWSRIIIGSSIRRH